MSALSDVIKRMSVEANEAEKNDKIFIGTVTSCNRTAINEDSETVVELKPFTVQLSDKLIFTMGDSFFKATNTMKEKLENTAPPLYFKEGDKVLVMRMDKGKTYLLIDKLGD